MAKRVNASARTLQGRNAVFRVSDWPMGYFARIERLHMQNATLLLAPHGLHHREWRMLAILSDTGAIGVNQLAEQAAIERSTISKMIDRLEARGLVRRASARADKRSSLVVLTPKGRAKLAETIPLVEGLFATYLAGMSKSDYARLMRSLVTLMGRVSAAVVKDPHRK